MDCSPPGSSVHGILQARILTSIYTLKGERIVFSCLKDSYRFLTGLLSSFWQFLMKSEGKVSVVQMSSDSATAWTVARQVLLSMGFSSQEYWSGLPCPSPGALPNPGIEPLFLTIPALAAGFFTTNQSVYFI